MMIFLRILIILVLAYVGLCVVLWIFQASFIYFPGAPDTATPGDVDLTFEEVWLEPAGGARVHAWFIPAANARGAVVFCHGNAGTIADRLATLKILHGLRLSALIFDYQGYGRSEGSPSESGTYADAEAAWRHLTEQRGYPTDRVLIWGRSLGGAVAVELAGRHQPAGLIVESSFTSVPDMARETFPIWIPARWICRHVYDAAARVPALTCPKIFLHSPDDEVIPFHHGERLHALAGDPKRFVRLAGDHNHGFLDHSPLYLAAVGKFVDEVLGR